MIGLLLYRHGRCSKFLLIQKRRARPCQDWALRLCGGGAARANRLLLEALQPGAIAVLSVEDSRAKLRSRRALALLSPDLKRAHALFKLSGEVGFG